MKYAIIDIGSNSVRLFLNENGKTILKTNKVTRLAEGMGKGLMLQPETVERTALAVSFFCKSAIDKGFNSINIFATQAVRNAKNKQIFIDRVKQLTNIDIDVVSGDREAELGLNGVLINNDGGIIDLGGASTEICVRRGGKIIYSKSLDIGAVKLYDMFGEDKVLLEKYLYSKIAEYGIVPNCNFYAIGGTATSICSIAQKMEIYDSEKITGYFLSLKELKSITRELYSKNVVERERIVGLQKERAKVIICGALALCCICEYLKIDGFTVSDNDNLEGYMYYLRSKNEQ